MSKLPKETQIIPWGRDATETKERKRRTRIKQVTKQKCVYKKKRLI